MKIPNRKTALAHLPLAAAIHLACFSLAFAADPDPQATGGPADQKTTELETLTVTAQKIEENPQNVPISLDVLTTQKLTEMNVADINDWVKLLPSVSTSSSQGSYQPGFGQISMRGVESGSNGNHSGPSPSVGIYLDEQPITTIVGAIDPHIYDIARIEALAGPQGTLYGASSESGTIRIITNKPDPSAFSASASLEANTIDHGGQGYIAEGYVNIPLTSWMALRAVGWSKQDAGYIDNVFGSRTFTGVSPVDGSTLPPITIDNAGRARKDYNVADTRGARAALKIDLNENWSITPSVVGQAAHVNGIYAFDPHIGDLKLTHFYPEDSEDRWIQSALTVQGKIGNFDVVYAASHLNRSDHYNQDYSDYSFWYDQCCGYGAYIHDNNGNLINPSQHIHAEDTYRKTSNELRVSSPRDRRFRFTVGAFGQAQSHDILQDYLIDGLGSDISVKGWPNTIWLTRQVRTDNDSAVFGEMSYDITDQLTGTLGARFFHTKDTLKGFFGYGGNGTDPTTYYFGGSPGQADCIDSTPFEGAPCTEFKKKVTQSDHIVRGNLTYKFDNEKMIYATYSEGFRPGGINRRGTLPPYQADFLDNYELGWKTEWLDRHLRWNGSVFEEKWKDFQFAIVGTNGLTEIHNANQARIRGLESNLTWAATYNLVISGGIAIYHSELTANYCGQLKADETPISSEDCTDPSRPDLVASSPLAPKGTQLPITPKVKGDITARYNFNAYGHEAYVQAAVFGTGRRRSDLRIAQNNDLGNLPGYGTFDLSAGFKQNQWSLDFYLKNAFDNRGQIANYAECRPEVCGGTTYIIPVQPRTLGMRVTRDF